MHIYQPGIGALVNAPVQTESPKYREKVRFGAWPLWPARSKENSHGN